MVESPLAKIRIILRKNLKSTWTSALGDYTNGKIGKLKLIQILSKDLSRMEDELKIYVDLMLKQRTAADLKPLWDDNLHTKAILGTLLDILENNESVPSSQIGERSKEDELIENMRSNSAIVGESRV